MRECSLILARALAFWSAVGSGAPHCFRRHGGRAEAWRLWKAVSQPPHSKTLPRGTELLEFAGRRGAAPLLSARLARGSRETPESGVAATALQDAAATFGAGGGAADAPHPSPLPGRDSWEMPCRCAGARGPEAEATRCCVPDMSLCGGVRRGGRRCLFPGRSRDFPGRR